MSVDMSTGDTGIDSLPDPDIKLRTGPQPVAHGAGVQAVFNDMDTSGGTAYQQTLDIWRDRVGDRDREPYALTTVKADEIDGLRPARHNRDYIFVLKSSNWKCGTGTVDDYTPWYKYDVILCEVDKDGEIYNPPLSIHLRIEPQEEQLVYKDGNVFEPVYGEGTRITCQTTWADSPEEVERRMLQSLDVALGFDPQYLRQFRNPNSRRLMKAEAHVRFDIGWKRQVVDALQSSEDLIAFGGMSEIESHRKRQREGWMEVLVDANRWHLLGFDQNVMNTEVKVYHAKGWANQPRSNPSHHPKLEASFSGVQGNGALPHVDEWDEVMQSLREIVSSHLNWAGVGRDKLVADDYFDGPSTESYEYEYPEGRRDQLRARYEAISTEVYREAMKSNTTAVYDILRALVVGQGGTYDYLEEHTGLARSTIRYHVARLEEQDIVERIGNPVIVVFHSIKILDKSEEVLRKVFPDDTAEDRAERAEERRERREEDDDDQDESTSDICDDETETDPDPQDLTARVWRPFADLALEPDQLASALNRDFIEAADVAVRVDPYDWLPDK